MTDIRASLQAYSDTFRSSYTQKQLEALSRGDDDVDQGRPSTVTFTANPLRMTCTELRFLTAICDAFRIRNEDHWEAALNDAKTRGQRVPIHQFLDLVSEAIRSEMKPHLSEFHADRVRRSSSSDDSRQDQEAESGYSP